MDTALTQPRYTTAEAARLLRASPRRVGAWAGTRASNMVPLTPGIDRDSRLLSFLQLVELHFALRLTDQYGFSMVKLRRFFAEVEDRRGEQHPLARQAYLASKNGLWLDLEESWVELGTGGQLGLPAVVEHAADRVDFDAKGIASAWWPDGRETGILVNPHLSWGAPIFAGTRVRPEALYDLWLAERDVTVVANAFGVTAAKVSESIQFMETRNLAA